MKKQTKILIIYILCFSFIAALVPFIGLNLVAENTNTKTVTVTKIWDENGATNLRPDDLTVTLKAKITEFQEGTTLNSLMKVLAGTAAAGNGTIDYNITSFMKASALDTTKNYQIVSTADSPDEIYIWYDNGTIYYYSDASVVYLNPDSGHMFQNMRNLTNISGLSSVNTSGVESLASFFDGDINLSDISPLSNWDTKNVKSLALTFRDCASITDLTPISNWNTGNVQNMNFTFGASSTTFNFSTLTGGMSYTSLSPLANWDTSNVTNMNQTFKGVLGLTALTGLENWDTSKVTDMSQMFEYCLNINDVTAMAKWDFTSVSDTTSMFLVSTNAQRVTITSTALTNSNRTLGSTTGWAGYLSNGLELARPYFTNTPTAISPTYTSHAVGTTYTTNSNNWVKNGNTWTYSFEVDADYDYYGYEDVPTYYTSDATESSPKDATNNALTINNTLDTTKVRLVTVTKNWSDNSDDSLRPDDITLNFTGIPIPAGYTAKEYVQNTNGGEYIQTDIPAYGSHTMYADGYALNSGPGGLINAYASGSSRMGATLLATGSNFAQIHWASTVMTPNYGATKLVGSDGSTNLNFGSRLQYTQDNTHITFVQNGVTYDYTYYLNGVFTGSTAAIGANYKLLGFSYGGTTKSDSNARLYNAKIYDDSGTLIHDFVPCVRDSDSATGVFDIITQTFYPSTGTLTTGNTVTLSATGPETVIMSKANSTVSGNTWTQTFAFDASTMIGSLYVYEDDVDYYSEDTDSSNTKAVTNNAVTLNNTATHKKITVTKSWADENNRWSFRPNGSNVSVKIVGKDASDNVETTVTLNDSDWDKTTDSDNWTQTVTVPIGTVTNWYAYEDETLLGGRYISSAPSTSYASITNNAVTITNTLKTYDLEVKKNVTGNLGETDKFFIITIEILDGNGNPINTTYANEYLSFAINGYNSTTGLPTTVTGQMQESYSAWLKNNYSIVINDIPSEFIVSVNEQVYSDYTTTYKMTNTNTSAVITAETTGQGVTNINLTQDTTITFNNHKEGAVATGVKTNSMMYYILTTIGIIAGISVIILRKKKII